MHVTNPQQLFLASSEPLVPGASLTLGAMAIAAGVVRDGRGVATAGTTVAVSAQRGCTAALDGAQSLAMESVQSKPLLESIAYRANDVGHLEGWPFHLFLCSRLDRLTWSGLENSALSIGVPAALR